MTRGPWAYLSAVREGGSHAPGPPLVQSLTCGTVMPDPNVYAVDVILSHSHAVVAPVVAFDTCGNQRDHCVSDGLRTQGASRAASPSRADPASRAATQHPGIQLSCDRCCGDCCHGRVARNVYYFRTQHHSTWRTESRMNSKKIVDLCKM